MSLVLFAQYATTTSIPTTTAVLTQAAAQVAQQSGSPHKIEATATLQQHSVPTQKQFYEKKLSRVQASQTLLSAHAGSTTSKVKEVTAEKE